MRVSYRDKHMSRQQVEIETFIFITIPSFLSFHSPIGFVVSTVTHLLRLGAKLQLQFIIPPLILQRKIYLEYQ